MTTDIKTEKSPDCVAVGGFYFVYLTCLGLPVFDYFKEAKWKYLKPKGEEKKPCTSLLHIKISV